MNLFEKLKAMFAIKPVKRTRVRKHNARREALEIRANVQGLFLVRVNRQWVLERNATYPSQNEQTIFKNLDDVAEALAALEILANEVQSTPTTEQAA